MTQSTDFIEQLAALAKKATDAPWHVSSYWHGTGPDERVFGMLVGDDDIATGIIDENPSPDDDSLSHDLDLIVLLRNSIPVILALGRERDALRKALEKIAACTSHNHNWVAGIARQALEGGNQ